MDTVRSGQVVFFGDIQVDLQTGWLSRGGRRTRLRRQLLIVLTALLERPGEVVSRQELRALLWPDNVVVDFEIDLNTVVARLREALGDSAESPRYVETLPKQGYRFLAPLTEGLEPGPLPGRRLRLLVLPFANAGGDPAEDYYSDAMTDEMITSLCRTAPDALAVIARTTAMHYKNCGKDVAQIGRELAVDYVLEGAVRREEEDRVAVSVQLIKASDQAHVFAERYESSQRDILAALGRAASDIARGLGLAAKPGDAPAEAPAAGPTRSAAARDPAAYDEYLQARCHIGKASTEGFAQARRHLERALERDPKLAAAYDALAEIDWFRGYYGFVPARKAFSEGMVNALRAVELDSCRGETQALLGEFQKIVDYNWPEVRRRMALALRLDPGSPLVRFRYAVSELMPHGRLDEALAQIDAALESDPLSLLIQGWRGVMLVLARRWDQALDQAGLLLRHFPRELWGPYIKGVAYREKRMFAEAVAALRQALEAADTPGLKGWLGLTLALGGKDAEARAVLSELEAIAARAYVPPTNFAWIHVGLGDYDRAFEWMDRAADEGDQYMMPIKSYRFLDPLRADPRFGALLRKMNLAP